MNRFKKMTVVVNPKDKSEMPVAEWGKRYFNDPEIEVWKNDSYQVMKRYMKAKVKGDPSLIWLSCKRIDRQPIHDWRELQEIKNELVGRYNEGVELYPSESRRVDTSNQYHLWVFSSPNYRIPFGFDTRLVSGEDVADEIGAVQRPFGKGKWWKELFYGWWEKATTWSKQKRLLHKAREMADLNEQKR